MYRKSIDIIRATILSPTIQVAIGMSLIIWISYFFMCSWFGLYQDDVYMYHLISKLRTTGENVLAKAFDFSQGYGGQGRPGNQVVMIVFTWIGSKLGGVTGLYMLNWILLSILALLVFYCFRHYFSLTISFLCSAFYILFPADEAKFFAVSYMSNVSAILFLIAVLLIYRGRVYFAALILLLVFTISEAYVLMGFLLPFLFFADKKIEMRHAIHKSIKYIAVYGLLMVPVVLLRLMFAPGRAAGALGHSDKVELAIKVIKSVYIGIRSSASSLHIRISEFFAHGRSVEWTIAAITFGILTLLMYRLTVPTTSSVESEDIYAQEVRIPYIIIFGLLAWAAAYPLYGIHSTRYPPSIVVGKDSNIHGPAAIGFSTLLAVVLHSIEIQRRTRRKVFHASRWAVILYLAFLSGSFVVVQQRYVDNWHYQLSFWRQLVEAVPNINPKSLVVVDRVDKENMRSVDECAFDWTLPHLFPFMWLTPFDWPASPLVMSKLYYDETARFQGDRVDIVGYPTLPTRSFSANEVIKLRVKEGRLYTQEESANQHSERSYQLFDERIVGSTRFLPGEFQLRADNRSHFSIIPNNMSGNGWKFGIHLNESGRNDMFYFLVANKNLNPVKAGSVLNFAATGKAVATRVDVAQQGDRYAVFVTVDRALNPDKDGYPNPIHVLRSN